jgi:hypothetical protein
MVAGRKRMLRDLIVTAGLTFLTSVGAVQACSSLQPPQTEDQLFARASAVFLAHLLRTEEINATTPLLKESQPVVEATFRALEVFKGQPPTDGKVRSIVYGPGNCSVPLLAGSDYLFFLYDSTRNFVLQLPGGSQMFINLEGREAKKILNQLRELANKGP